MDEFYIHLAFHSVRTGEKIQTGFFKRKFESVAEAEKFRSDLDYKFANRLSQILILDKTAFKESGFSAIQHVCISQQLIDHTYVISSIIPYKTKTESAV